MPDRPAPPLLPPPEAVDALAPQALPAFVAHLAALTVRAAVRMATVPAQKGAGATEDRLLTIDEAAALLATTPNWLRHHNELPFTVHLSPGQVRYSARKLAQWIALRAGKGAC